MAGVAAAGVGVVDESDDLVGEDLAVVLRREYGSVGSDV